MFCYFHSPGVLQFLGLLAVDADEDLAKMKEKQTTKMFSDMFRNFYIMCFRQLYSLT